MRTFRRVCLLLLSVLFLSACGLPQAFTTKQVAGLIPNDPGLGAEVISAPATAVVNQPMTLTINTYGSSSCITPDGARVGVDGLTATITPFDRVPRGDVACTADLAAHPRTVTLTFAEPGEALIQVIGQDFDGTQTIIERRLTVTP